MPARHLGTLLLLLALAGTAARNTRSEDEVAEPVLGIGRTQLFLGSAAYPVFCEEHDAAKRSRLRTDTV